MAENARPRIAPPPGSGPLGIRLAGSAALVGVGAAVLAVSGVLGAGADLWSAQVGMILFQVSLWIAAAGVLIALAALAIGISTRRGQPATALLGLAAGAALLGVGFYSHSQYVKFPPIHDITTGLTETPVFRKLPVSDDRGEVPANGRADLQRLSGDARWRVYLAEAYGDVKPIVVARPPADVNRIVGRLIRERGWHLALNDAVNGRFEATDTVPPFGFKDDILVLTRPAGDLPGGTLVTMRSVSRMAGGDGGRNGNRIRGFLLAIQRAVK